MNMNHRSLLIPVFLMLLIALLVSGSCSNLILESENVDEIFVQTDKANLSLVLAQGDSLDSITQNITVPDSIEEGTTITWSSSDTATLTIDGVVTRPTFDAGSKTVTLTATLVTGTASTTKTFTLVIIPVQATDAEAVEAAKAAIEIGYAAGDSATNVTQSVTLTTSGSNGTTIIWSSDNAAITSGGTVTRPPYMSGNATVTLTATISKAGSTDTKVFMLTVLRLAQSDTESVADGKASLAITYGGSDTASSVTVNLASLPATSSSGTTVSWATNDAAHVTAAGIVTRPTFAGGDTTVILIATISKGSVTDTKTFTITVKAAGTGSITVTLPVAPAATELVFRSAIPATITNFTVVQGTPVTINTAFAGTSYAWYVDNGTTAVSTTSNCTINGNSYSLGNHTLLLDVLAGGTYYSGRIDFIVTLP